MSLNHRKEYNREIRGWLEQVFAFAAALPRELLQRRKCPACGAAQSVFFANNDYLDYERCSSCSLVFMNPAPSPQAVAQGFQGEDRLLMEYFAICSRYKSEAPAEAPDPTRDNKLKDIFALKPSGRLLDVGCSVGDFLHKAKHFYQVEGVEVNPQTAAVAQRHFTVHTGMLRELALPPVYDVVTLHQILYGIHDVAGLLTDIRALLADDGLLYINTPNADSYAMELYGGKANHLYGYTTLNVFNERSLAALAGRCGFRIVSLRTEWLDIYTPDLAEFYDHRERFIHKRNCHLPGYEEKIQLEDEVHRSVCPELGKRGNYLVAVLKSGEPCEWR